MVCLDQFCVTIPVFSSIPIFTAIAAQTSTSFTTTAPSAAEVTKINFKLTCWSNSCWPNLAGNPTIAKDLCSRWFLSHQVDDSAAKLGSCAEDIDQEDKLFVACNCHAKEFPTDFPVIPSPPPRVLKRLGYPDPIGVDGDPHPPEPPQNSSTSKRAGTSLEKSVSTTQNVSTSSNSNTSTPTLTSPSTTKATTTSAAEPPGPLSSAQMGFPISPIPIKLKRYVPDSTAAVFLQTTALANVPPAVDIPSDEDPAPLGPLQNFAGHEARSRNHQPKGDDVENDDIDPTTTRAPYVRPAKRAAAAGRAYAPQGQPKGSIERIKGPLAIVKPNFLAPRGWVVATNSEGDIYTPSQTGEVPAATEDGVTYVPKVTLETTSHDGKVELPNPTSVPLPPSISEDHFSSPVSEGISSIGATANTSIHTATTSNSPMNATPTTENDIAISTLTSAPGQILQPINSAGTYVRSGCEPSSSSIKQFEEEVPVEYPSVRVTRHYASIPPIVKTTTPKYTQTFAAPPPNVPTYGNIGVPPRNATTTGVYATALPIESPAESQYHSTTVSPLLPSEFSKHDQYPTTAPNGPPYRSFGGQYPTSASGGSLHDTFSTKQDLTDTSSWGAEQPTYPTPSNHWNQTTTPGGIPEYSSTPETTSRVFDDRSDETIWYTSNEQIHTPSLQVPTSSEHQPTGPGDHYPPLTSAPGSPGSESYSFGTGPPEGTNNLSGTGDYFPPRETTDANGQSDYFPPTTSDLQETGAFPTYGSVINATSSVPGISVGAESTGYYKHEPSITVPVTSSPSYYLSPINTEIYQPTSEYLLPVQETSYAPEPTQQESTYIAEPTEAPPSSKYNGPGTEFPNFPSSTEQSNTYSAPGTYWDLPPSEQEIPEETPTYAYTPLPTSDLGSEGQATQSTTLGRGSEPTYSGEGTSWTSDEVKTTGVPTPSAPGTDDNYFEPPTIIAPPTRSSYDAFESSEKLSPPWPTASYQNKTMITRPREEATSHNPALPSDRNEDDAYSSYSPPIRTSVYPSDTSGTRTAVYPSYGLVLNTTTSTYSASGLDSESSTYPTFSVPSNASETGRPIGSPSVRVGFDPETTSTPPGVLETPTPSYTSKGDDYNLGSPTSTEEAATGQYSSADDLGSENTGAPTTSWGSITTSEESGGYGSETPRPIDSTPTRGYSSANSSLSSWNPSQTLIPTESGASTCMQTTYTALLFGVETVITSCGKETPLEHIETLTLSSVSIWPTSGPSAPWITNDSERRNSSYHIVEPTQPRESYAYVSQTPSPPVFVPPKNEEQATPPEDRVGRTSLLSTAYGSSNETTTDTRALDTSISYPTLSPTNYTTAPPWQTPSQNSANWPTSSASSIATALPSQSDYNTTKSPVRPSPTSRAAYPSHSENDDTVLVKLPYDRNFTNTEGQPEYPTSATPPVTISSPSPRNETNMISSVSSKDVFDTKTTNGPVYGPTHTRISYSGSTVYTPGGNGSVSTSTYITETRISMSPPYMNSNSSKYLTAELQPPSTSNYNRSKIITTHAKSATDNDISTSRSQDTTKGDGYESTASRSEYIPRPTPTRAPNRGDDDIYIPIGSNATYNTPTISRETSGFESSKDLTTTQASPSSTHNGMYRPTMPRVDNETYHYPSSPNLFSTIELPTETKMTTDFATPTAGDGRFPVTGGLNATSSTDRRSEPKTKDYTFIPSPNKTLADVSQSSAIRNNSTTSGWPYPTPVEGTEDRTTITTSPRSAWSTTPPRNATTSILRSSRSTEKIEYPSPSRHITTQTELSSIATNQTTRTASPSSRSSEISVLTSFQTLSSQGVVDGGEPGALKSQSQTGIVEVPAPTNLPSTLSVDGSEEDATFPTLKPTVSGTPSDKDDIDSSPVETATKETISGDPQSPSLTPTPSAADDETVPSGIILGPTSSRLPSGELDEDDGSTDETEGPGHKNFNLSGPALERRQVPTPVYIQVTTIRDPASGSTSATTTSYHIQNGMPDPDPTELNIFGLPQKAPFNDYEASWSEQATFSSVDRFTKKTWVYEESAIVTDQIGSLVTTASLVTYVMGENGVGQTIQAPVAPTAPPVPASVNTGGLEITKVLTIIQTQVAPSVNGVPVVPNHGTIDAGGERNNRLGDVVPEPRTSVSTPALPASWVGSPWRLARRQHEGVEQESELAETTRVPPTRTKANTPLAEPVNEQVNTIDILPLSKTILRNPVPRSNPVNHQTQLGGGPDPQVEYDAGDSQYLDVESLGDGRYNTPGPYHSDEYILTEGSEPYASPTTPMYWEDDIGVSGGAGGVAANDDRSRYPYNNLETPTHVGTRTGLPDGIGPAPTEPPIYEYKFAYVFGDVSDEKYVDLGKMARERDQKMGKGCTFNPGQITEAGWNDVYFSWLKVNIMKSVFGNHPYSASVSAYYSEKAEAEKQAQQAAQNKKAGGLGGGLGKVKRGLIGRGGMENTAQTSPTATADSNGGNALDKRQMEELLPSITDGSQWTVAQLEAGWYTVVGRCLLACKERGNDCGSYIVIEDSRWGYGDEWFCYLTPKKPSELSRETDFICKEQTKDYQPYIYDLGENPATLATITVPDQSSTASDQFEARLNFGEEIFREVLTKPTPVYR